MYLFDCYDEADKYIRIFELENHCRFIKRDSRNHTVNSKFEKYLLGVFCESPKFLSTISGNKNYFFEKASTSICYTQQSVILSSFFKKFLLLLFTPKNHS